MIHDKSRRKELRASVDRLAKARGAPTPDEVIALGDCDRPIRVIHGDAVPISGSVHLTLGRVISRKNINRLLRK